VLTDVNTDDGVVGHSMVFTYTPAALKPTAGLIQNFETLVKGEPLTPIEIEQKLAKRFRLLGTQGLVGIALSAIDMALWDALARSHGTSLVRLLGGMEKPIPAYGAVGYDGVEGSAKVAEDWAKRGFSGIKAKIGYPTALEDVAVVRAMRKAVGEQNRIINRMKAALIRLGIRGFNPKLKKAAGRLKDLRTPEGEPIPPNTLAELRRDMERRRLVSDQIRQIEEARLERLEQASSDGPHAMVRLLARVIGVGTETADMLVQEVLSRNMRDRRAVARYAGLTGSPDESGRKCREKGLARSGNARVRRGTIQLAWRLLMFQKNSALAQWFRARTENARGSRKTMIVALARKLLIALWRLVREGVVPDGVVLRPAQ
jgi:hypothetical protein